MTGWRNGLTKIPGSSRKANASSASGTEQARTAALVVASRTESNFAEKYLEVLVNESNMRQQPIFVAETAEHILGCLSKNAASRLRDMIIASSGSCTCVQFWDPQQKTDIE